MTKLENNDDVLAGIKVIVSALAWFQPTLKGWHKQAGSKPTDAMLMVPVLMGKRPGVEALHVAMCLRPEGCTVAQFCLAGSCGPANNYRRQLVKAGWFATTVEGKPYAFKLTVTAKGAAKLEKATIAFEAEASVAKADKPAKPAKKPTGKRKGAKVINTPAPETATSDAPAADTGVAETVVGPHSDVVTHAEMQPTA